MDTYQRSLEYKSDPSWSAFLHPRSSFNVILASSWKIITTTSCVKFLILSKRTSISGLFFGNISGIISHGTFSMGIAVESCIPIAVSTALCVFEDRIIELWGVILIELASNSWATICPIYFPWPGSKNQVFLSYFPWWTRIYFFCSIKINKNNQCIILIIL